MKVIAFLTDDAVVGRIISHLQLACQEVLFYDSPRRDGPKLGGETSFSKHGRKRTAYKKLYLY